MDNNYIEMDLKGRLPDTSKVEDTPRILEKFTNEEGEVDVERMASKMSKTKKQNYTFKKMFLCSSLFLVVVVGLMISANIIGALFLKDTKVRDNQLVSKDNKAISVGTSLYKVPVYLFSTEEVLSGLKYLEVPVVLNGDNSTLHMRIDTYITIPGKQIFFIGEKYSLLLQRHNYELFLNDDNFDPLSLKGLNNTGDISESIDNSNQTVRRVFRSDPESDGKKRVHPTVQISHKREAQGEDTTQEFVVLSGKGTVAVPAQQRAFNNLIYHSGNPLVTNGKVIMIVWNDQTNGKFGASNLKTCYDNLPTFFNDLLKTKLFTQLTPGKKGSDPQSKVTSIDQTVRYLSPSAARKKVTLYDSDIGNQLMDWLNAGQLPKDTSNKLNYMYMIFFPSGIKLSSGFCSSYCGFHTYRSGYIYSVLPWVGDCMGSCGMSSYVSTFGGNTCGSLQSVAAHELTEMATDPYLSTYYDVNGWENADKCAWTSPACYKNPSTGNSYCIQQQWNHTASSSSAYDAGCTRNLQW